MSFTVENIKEFNDALKEVNDKVKKEIMRKAYADAVKPLIQQARATTTSQRVRKSIGAKYYPDANGGFEFVGARTSKVYQGYLARWEEEGTKERYQKHFKEKARRTGKVTGSWFFNRAVQNTQGAIFNSIYDTFTNAFVTILNKHSKKFNKNI